MNRTHNERLIIVAFVISTVCPSWTQNVGRLPSTQEIVSHMAQVERQRYLGFSGYSGLRSYKIVNGSHWAEMFVRTLCEPDGGKRFSILREEGSPIIRKQILHKLLEEETNASYLGTRIIPQNYFFNLIGIETAAGRPAYVLEVAPKTNNKDLFQGRIWVDASDYAVTRIEGIPAHKPSFWIKTVHFVHTYERVHDLWLPYSTVSTIEVRIFGTAELWVENSDYKLSAPDDVSRDQDRGAQLPP